MKVTANGIEIHYRFDGPAEAPAVVLSHSLAAHLGMWEDQLPILSEYRVLRYDTRGHGGTDAPEGEYTLGQLAGDRARRIAAVFHQVGASQDPI